jgi:uncharacterized protein (UPF0335 family)
MTLKLAYFILFAFLIPFQGNAQIPATPSDSSESEQLSDQELKRYLQATYRAQSIYNEDNKKMADTLKTHGLDVDKYNKILNARKKGESADEESSEISESEFEKFNTVSMRILKMQESMESRIVDAIESNGIELGRFDEIFEMIQNDPALRARVEVIMKEMAEWNE